MSVASWALQPWPWWAGGLVIGLLVPVLYYLFNIGLGVSTGYGSLIKAVNPSTRLKWLNTAAFSDRWGWRLFFLGGMVLGGTLANALLRQPAVSTDMGLLTKTLPWPTAAVGLFLLVGGLLMGLGARLADGCTSGHCIHGLATGQRSSLVITVLFLLLGAVATNVVRSLLLGGAG